MPANYATLYTALLNNVVEVRFLHRRQFPNLPPIRKMLCTNNTALLTSPNGRIVLSYRTPTHALKFNPAQKNLIVTWDILMKDFRIISLDNCEIIQQHAPTDEFWNYFNQTFYPMSALDKIRYMSS